MADEQGCASPLELFNCIAAQGERVRALKAGQALKVGDFAGSPRVHPTKCVGSCYPGAHCSLNNYCHFGYNLTFVFSFINIFDACDLKKSHSRTAVVHLPIPLSCSQEQVLSLLLADSLITPPPPPYL